ncbi:MAG: ABC transporter substrate-binding protein [Limnochordia bacterium]
MLKKLALRLIILFAAVLVFANGFSLAKTLDLEGVINNTSTSGRFDVYHWWTAGGEREAIDTAIAVFEERYPNLKVVSNAVPGGAGGAMVMKVQVLALTGNSPESFQAHPGLEIEPYYDADMLLDLTDLWHYADLNNRILPSIAQFSQFENRYFLIPIGIHKTNVVWYNIHMFKEYGVEPPEEPVTWEAFIALCEELSQKLPKGKYPLDLGDRRGWPATHTFETLMIGIDPQIYEDFINGKATLEQVELVLERFSEFMKYVAPDHSARLWYESAGRLVAGDYAMYLQGSWMQAYFTSLGWEYGVDYGAFSAPGTSGYFGVSIDGFVVPASSRGVENGVRWAYMITDPELQIEFSKAKESISPYSDTPPEIYNELSYLFYQQLHDENIKIYPSCAHGTALPWMATTDLHSRISDFATTSNPDVTRYARLITQSLKEAGVRGHWEIK